MDKAERARTRSEARAKAAVLRALERQAERERLAYEHGRLDWTRREQVDRAPYRNPALLAHYRRGWDSARDEWERWQAGRVLDATHRANIKAHLAQVRASCGLESMIERE